MRPKKPRLVGALKAAGRRVCRAASVRTPPRAERSRAQRCQAPPFAPTIAPLTPASPTGATFPGRGAFGNSPTARQSNWGGKPIQTIGKSGPFSAKFEEIAHCVASLCALFQPAIQADIVAHSIIRAVYYEGAARRFDIIGHVSDRVLIDHHQCRQLLASPILSGPRFSSTLNRECFLLLRLGAENASNPQSLLAADAFEDGGLDEMIMILIGADLGRAAGTESGTF
ncbi:hypothetical protein HUJ04_000358 [Dendroctonus ponderosae]|nr:hypothetical protein HUJ04_000358 [Dendroctonus ponderosae]